MDVLADLKTSVLSHGLTETELQALANICVHKSFYKNEKIFDETDDDDSLYVLVEGRVCIERYKKGDRTVMPTQLITVKKGQVFGEMAFLEKRSRSATARAKGNVRLIAFSSAQFEALLKENYVLGYKIMKNLATLISHRLRKMNEHWLSSTANTLSLVEFEYR